MKMVKKILLGTLAVAAVLSLASCGKREEAGNIEIKVGAGSKSASIDFKNEGEDTARGFKSLQTKHLDAICKIETTVTDLVAGKGAVATGTMGYIFNLVKGTDDKYSFTIAGARYNQSTGNVEAYVETFKNIAKDDLEKSLTGGIKADGSPAYVNGFGFKLLDKTEVDYALAQQSTTPKKLELWIDVVANDGTTTGRTGPAGTYTVSFYKADPERNSSATSFDLTYGSNKSAALIRVVTIKATEVFAPYDATRGLTSMQSDVGFYANVYKGQTLKGKWQFSQIKKEAEEIEE